MHREEPTVDGRCGEARGSGQLRPSQRRDRGTLQQGILYWTPIHDMDYMRDAIILLQSISFVLLLIDSFLLHMQL